jgi:hypothetical protein
MASDAALTAVVSGLYNGISGVGQETLELGITASGKVASIAAPLAESTVASIVGYANLAKLGWDGATFFYGYFRACRP